MRPPVHYTLHFFSILVSTLHYLLFLFEAGCPVHFSLLVLFSHIKWYFWLLGWLISAPNRRPVRRPRKVALKNRIHHAIFFCLEYIRTGAGCSCVSFRIWKKVRACGSIRPCALSLGSGWGYGYDAAVAVPRPAAQARMMMFAGRRAAFSSPAFAMHAYQ